MGGGSMPVVIKIILCVVSFFAGIYSIDFLIRRFGLFEYRDNPYRRYCRKCGQLQNQFEFNQLWSKEDPWWEDVGEIFDPDCECHKHSKYVR